MLAPNKKDEATQIKQAFFATLAIAIVLTIFYSAILYKKSFFSQDHTYYFEPLIRFISNTVAQGKIALWNPLLFCGMPQIAVPSPGVFYPFNLIFLITDYTRGLGFLLAFHQLIAFLGAFLLVASLNWGFLAATVFGLIVALSGYMFTLTTNITLIESAAWIPITLWAFRKLSYCIATSDKAERSTFAYATIAPILLFLNIASGRPEVFLPGLILISTLPPLEVLLRYPHMRTRKQLTRLLFWHLITLFSGIALTMPILLPVIEWARSSPRAHGLNLSQTLMWSSNWYDLLNIVFARPFGDLHILGATYLSYVATRPVYMPFLPSSFIGPVAITLAIWGLSDRSWKWRFWIVLAIVATLIAMLGEYTPVAPFFCKMIPTLTTFRYPIKAIIFLLAFIGLCSARGIQLYGKGELGKKAEIISWCIWTTTLLIGLFLVLTNGIFSLPFNLTKLLVPAGALILIGRSLCVGASLGIAVCIAPMLSRRNVISHRKIAPLIVAALFCNLIVTATFCFPYLTKEGFFAHKAFIAKKLKALASKENKKNIGRELNLYFDPICCPDSYCSNEPRLYTVGFFQYGRDLGMANSNLDTGIEETFGYEAAELGEYRLTFFSILHQCSAAKASGRKFSHDITDAKEPPPRSDLPLAKFCAVTSTRWVCTQVYKSDEDVPYLDSKYFSVAMEDEDMNLRIYRVKNQLPKIYTTKTWSWVPSQDKATDELISADAAFDPSVLTLIEHYKIGEPEKRRTRFNFLAPEMPLPPVKSPLKYPLTDKETADTTFGATKVHRGDLLQNYPEHVAYSIKLKEPSFVVLTDQFYPGWQASIDGVPQATYRANGFMRAVYVPLGAHLVEFNYQPDSLRIGYLCAAIGAFFIAVFGFWAISGRLWHLLKVMAGQA